MNPHTDHAFSLPYSTGILSMSGDTGLKKEQDLDTHLAAASGAGSGHH